jgi:trigger factor
MEIELTDKDYCVVGVHYEANAEEIEKKRDEVLQQFRKRPCPGFRPGKADMTSIRLHYARQIEDSLKRALVEQAFIDTIVEKGIKPFGTPEFSSLSLLNKKFTCDFNLRKKPEFELAQYKELELPRPAPTTSIEAIAQQTLQDLRIKLGEGIPFVEDDVVQMTDNVIVDYDVFHDDKKIDQLCAQGELLTIGRSHLPEFDKSLLGMKAGEKREFNITVPDFGMASVAGKSLKFVVSVLSGSKIKPMPLDDSLAQKAGKKDLQELLSFANELASAQYQEAIHKQQTAAIKAKLVDNHDIKVPQWLTDSEVQYLVASAKIDWEKMADVDKAQYVSLAEKNVKLSLILDKVRETEPETQLSDNEVLDIVQGMLGKMSKSKEEIEKLMNEMSKGGQLQVISSRLRDEHALDFILKTTKWID